MKLAQQVKNICNIFESSKPNWAPSHAIWFQRAEDGDTTAYVSRINDKYTYEIFDKHGKTLKKEHDIPSLADAKKEVFKIFGEDTSESFLSEGDAEIESWLEKAKQAVDASEEKQWGKDSVHAKELGWKKNKKFYQVWTSLKDGSQRSAYAFIDFDGNIYKAAGWGVPAKGSRGNINNKDASLVTTNTGWLYRG